MKSYGLKAFVQRECCNWTDARCIGVGLDRQTPTAVHQGESCPVPGGSRCPFFETCLRPLGRQRPKEYGDAVAQYDQNVLKSNHHPPGSVESTAKSAAAVEVTGGAHPSHLGRGVRAAEGL